MYRAPTRACLALRRLSTYLSTSKSPPQAHDPLTLSEVVGPAHPPLVEKTLPAYFRDDILRVHGSRPALVARKEGPRPFGGPGEHNLGDAPHLAWDFGEFDRHIQALARGLLSVGVKKGDRVGVIMGNNRCVRASGGPGLDWMQRVDCVLHVQRVCMFAVGVCKHWCDPSYAQSSVQAT